MHQSKSQLSPIYLIILKNLPKQKQQGKKKKTNHHSVVCLTERKSNQKVFALASFGSGVVYFLGLCMS